MTRPALSSSQVAGFEALPRAARLASSQFRSVPASRAIKPASSRFRSAPHHHASKQPASERFPGPRDIAGLSQLSIFSELNNLSIISMDEHFAGICGITQDELEGQMQPDVDALAATLGITHDEALAQLKANYDGYHFCARSPDIYNPFSLLSALAKGEIGSYWFTSGTPTALLNMMRENAWELSDLEGVEASEDEFDVPTEAMQTPLPMLYQGGYLTIKSFDPLAQAYTLGVPNAEVARGLSRSLVAAASGPRLGEFNG